MPTFTSRATLLARAPAAASIARPATAALATTTVVLLLLALLAAFVGSGHANPGHGPLPRSGRPRRAWPEHSGIRLTVASDEGPAFDFTVDADGAATLDAKRGLALRGAFVGIVDRERVDRLLDLATWVRLDDQQMRRGFDCDDAHAATWTVRLEGGCVDERVDDRGRIGPADLWALQECLERTREQVDWKPRP